MKDETVRISGDILCDGCGASLHGMALEETCKCGKKVRDAIQGTLVQWGVPELKRLQEAVRWMAWGWVGFLGGLVVNAFARTHSEWAGLQVYALMSFLLVFAAWRYTAVPADKFGRREKVIRASGVVFLAGVAFEYLMNTGWRYRLYLAGMHVPYEVDRMVPHCLALGLVVFYMQMGGRLADLCSAAGMAARRVRGFSRLCWVGTLGVVVMMVLFKWGVSWDLGPATQMINGVAVLTVSVAGVAGLIGIVGMSIAWFGLLKRVGELRELGGGMEGE